MLNEIIELVQWVDSFGCASQWGEVSEPGKPIPVVYCYSIGFVVAEDAHTLVLVPHMHPENKAVGATKSGCGDMAIPKCSIVKREVIGKLADWDMTDE